MSGIRLLAVGLLAIGLSAAPTARAAVQLYRGSWIAESFGNDLTGGTGASAQFSVLGIPFGLLCNPAQPRCSFSSTPVSTPGGAFSAPGTVCTPIAAFGTTMRPDKYPSYFPPLPGISPPLYRNPFFFTPGGAPKNATSCGATTTLGQKGAPLTGSGTASLTRSLSLSSAGFTIPAAPPTPTMTTGPTVMGMRRTAIGSFNKGPPWLYSYTYATLRNDKAAFFPGGGPGNFTLTYKHGATRVAKVIVKKGANQFGGVMRLLGRLNAKVCYFRNGGCSLGLQAINWRYDAIGAEAYTAGGVVTGGYVATSVGRYYHTHLMQTETVTVVGARFPWTTGSVSVTAAGRGPHKTIERRKGFDNRTALGKGTIQLVTPIITRWLQPSAISETTGGIGILRLQFVPEPHPWMMLVAGLSLLGVLHRIRGR